MSEDFEVTITVDHTTLLLLQMIRESTAAEPPKPTEDMGGLDQQIAAKAWDRWSDLDYAGRLLTAWRALRLLQERVDVDLADAR